ncbi:RecQ family ATP-dependent DNA helicase [Odoribacter lunatus]|uniref:RecQ family ATP-dependent DNA helicase n=1 Tax=Odoribacter lunatus TaxID=2941335 RepID=UPI00203B95A7|nr:ATP-dependent DNA helicase RecQ [Odoribacter lunatus]
MTEIKDILKQYWGYDGFRSLQEEIIRSVLEGHDTLALMPTGGGKSLTYQIATLAREGLGLVITPLIALMKDQVEDLKKRNISAEAIYTGISPEQTESILNKCIYNGVKFLYISPERLVSEKFRIRLKQMPVGLIAVDEAHCISQWGYDFRPSYLRIAEVRTFFPFVPILALTATATPPVVKDIQRCLHFREERVLSKSFRRENLAYVVRKVNDKLSELLHILSRIEGSGIVYVRKRAGAEELARFLNENGIRADFYHAGLSPLLREKKQEAWKSNHFPVMVATNAFGMGIDKSDVRSVVHFDIPDSPEAYFQEAGRAGRDGQKAFAVLLCNEATVAALKERVTKGYPDKEFIRQVYDCLGNYFQIAEGAGDGYAFEFDMADFIRKFKLEQIRTLSALSILQVGGYLECTTEINSKSRICFMVSREQLDEYNFRNHLAEKLLVLLMRKYGGIFVQYMYIGEQYLADELGCKRQEVYDTLLELSRQRIISYIPGNDRPYIVYHRPRLPLSYLTIGKEAYEERKKSYQEKVTEMVRYIEEPDKCRQLSLMRYFGQKETVPCGICDVCLAKRKASRSDRQAIRESILAQLRLHEMEIKELVRIPEASEEEVIVQIRRLLDEALIYYKTPTTLSINEK